MTPETAYWFLSTIAQVTAALVGLVIVATVFVLGELRRTISESDNAEEYVLRVGRLAGTPSTFVTWTSILAVVAVIIGGFTALEAVMVIGQVEEVLTDEVQGRVFETQIAFTAFMFVTLTFAAFAAAVGYAAAGREAVMFEQAHGGKGEIGKLIKVKIEESQRKQKGGKGRARAHTRHLNPEVPTQAEDASESVCKEDEGV